MRKEWTLGLWNTGPSYSSQCRSQVLGSFGAV